MGADTGRANLRLGPNIPCEAAELLLDTAMPLEPYIAQNGDGLLDRERLLLRKISAHLTLLRG